MPTDEFANIHTLMRPLKERNEATLAVYESHLDLITSDICCDSKKFLSGELYTYEDLPSKIKKPLDEEDEDFAKKYPHIKPLLGMLRVIDGFECPEDQFDDEDKKNKFKKIIQTLMGWIYARDLMLFGMSRKNCESQGFETGIWWTAIEFKDKTEEIQTKLVERGQQDGLTAQLLKGFVSDICMDYFFGEIDEEDEDGLSLGGEWSNAQQMQCFLTLYHDAVPANLRRRSEDKLEFRRPNGQFLDFMIKLVKVYKPKTILNFNAGDALLERYIGEEFPDTEINMLASDLNATGEDAFPYPKNLRTPQWDTENSDIVPNDIVPASEGELDELTNQLLGDAFSSSGIDFKSDLIVSVPHHVKSQVKLNQGTPLWNDLGISVSNREYVNNIRLLISILRGLNDNGRAIFVAPKYQLGMGANSALWALEQKGFHITARIEIPAGTLDTKEYELIIIEKQKHNEIFVGEYSENEGSQDQLIENLKNRSSSKSITLGHLIKKEDFLSIKAVIAEKEARDLGNELGLKEHNFRDLYDGNVSSIHRLNHNREFAPSTEDKTNIIYVPFTIGCKAYTYITSKILERSRYLKIPLKNSVNADYVAGLLNHSQIGKLIKESITIDGRRTSERNWSNAKIYLADYGLQMGSLEIIMEFKTILDDIDRRTRELYEKPTKENIRNAKRYLSLKNSVDKEAWLANVPYPIAGSYKAYQSPVDPKEKLENLQRFFECLAQFYAVIHISALSNDEMLWKEILKKLSEEGQSVAQMMRRPTFGTWINILQIASKVVRRECSAEYQSSRYMESLYCMDRDTLLNCFCDKKLFKAIDVVREKRNDQAHHRLTTKEEIRNALLTMQNEFIKIQPLLINGWKDTFLFTPSIITNFDGNTHSTKVKKVRGISSKFDEDIFELERSLISNRLYLKTGKFKNALKLRRLIQLLPAEEALKAENPDTIYYYNESKGDEIHYRAFNTSNNASKKVNCPEINATINTLFEQEKEE